MEVIKGEPSSSIFSSQAIVTKTLEEKPKELKSYYAKKHWVTATIETLVKIRNLEDPAMALIDHDSEINLNFYDIVTMELHTWLSKHSLVGYLKVADAPPPLEAQEIDLRVHLDTITNDQIRSMLGLKRNCHHEIEIPPQHVLEAHFGEYSESAKAYRTLGPNKVFGDARSLDLAKHRERMRTRQPI